MYYVIRGVPFVALVIWLSTVASSKVATYTAEQALGQNWQLCLTGLAGIVTAVAVGYASVLLLSFLSNRD